MTAVTVSLAIERGGRLLETAGGHLELFQAVHEGQLLFRVDDRPLLGELAILQAELARQRLEIIARRVELERTEADDAAGRALTRERLFIEVDERRLDVLDRRAALAADEIELQRLNVETEHLAALAAELAETSFTLRMASLRRDALASRLAEDREALQRAEERFSIVLERLELLPSDPLPLVESDALADLLSPARAELDVLERRMDAVRNALAMLEIRAPRAGVISAVHRRAGESALPGEPIITITDPTATHVIAYLPEPGLLNVDIDQSVAIRPAGAAGALLQGRIVAVGPGVEAIPPEFARDPAAAERMGWGLPVRIALPAGARLRPGQRVEVRLGPA